MSMPTRPLASSDEMKDYIATYGCERILFGSDFPFGDPQTELLKILNLSISDKEKELLLSGNILRLMSESNRES